MNNFNDIGGFIKDVILGKKTNPEADHDEPDAKHQMALEKAKKALDKQKALDKEKLIKNYNNRDDLQQNLKKKGDKEGININRNIVTFRIIYPSLSFAFEWFLKETVLS